MQSQRGRLFSSKILLFGEYSLMKGSKALSIPFERYAGRLEFSDQQGENDPELTGKLKKFAEFSLKYARSTKNNFGLNAEKFLDDVDRGLTFSSNIPQGYGLGSSGALVAAVTECYCEGIDRVTPSEELKTFLAGLESYFHGKSSGLDPMVSLLNKPLLVTADGSVSCVSLPVGRAEADGAVFLIDTGHAGNTHPLVGYFLSQCDDPQYDNLLATDYIPVNDKCIGHYMEDKVGELFGSLENLSSMQLELFCRMIPDRIKRFWKKGLDSGDYYLKLCGSGGGGMILGFTRDTAKIINTFSGIKIHFVHPI